MRIYLILIACACSWIAPLSAETGNTGLVFQALTSEQADWRAEVHGGQGVPLYADQVKPVVGPDDGHGASVAVGGNLVYEGRGNFFIPSGTVGFWWRPDDALQVADASVLGLSSMQRFYFCRWINIQTKSRKLHVTLYHADGADIFDDPETIRVPERQGRRSNRKNIRYGLVAKDVVLNEGQWYYITVTWDMGKGVALYVDGKKAHEISEPWFYAGNVNHIALGGSSVSYAPARAATFPQSFASVKIYDYAMDADQIASLMAGEPIQKKVDWSLMLSERLKRFGLSPDSALPAYSKDYPQGHAMWIRKLEVMSARDVLRSTRAGVDGDLGRAWPMYQGYSNSGERLDIELEENARFNVVQALGSGPMNFEVTNAGGESIPLLDFNSNQTKLESRFFAEDVEQGQIQVIRDHGLLFNTEFLDARMGPLPVTTEHGWEYFSLAEKEASLEEYTRIREEFAVYDRAVLHAELGNPIRSESQGGESVSVESGAKALLSLPAGQFLHLMGPKVMERQGLAAIALDLNWHERAQADGAANSTEGGMPQDVEMTLMLLDPVNDVRRAMTVNLRVLAGSGGLKLVLDPNDLIFAEGRQPWLVLLANQDLNLDLANSRVGYQWISPEQAKEQFYRAQFAEVHESFQERSEGRPWSRNPKVLKLLGTLLDGIDALLDMKPNDPVARGYWHWTHPREQTPNVTLPEVPAGVPEWAFYSASAAELFREAAHWWIDHRQSEIGEFGAPDGINDDTDLIQDWLALDLMNGPDEKLRKAVEKVAWISWELKTRDGVSNKITDTLHMYEWGINAQTLAFLMNYGDPVYYERLLRFSSHYSKWMEETEDGHLHFKTWYFGAGGIRTEGVYARDILLNALMLQPAMLLGWYNGDPYNRNLVVRWVDSMREHLTKQAEQTNRIPGIYLNTITGKAVATQSISISFPDAVWAAWKFSGQSRFLELAGNLIDWNMTRRPLRSLHSAGSIVASYLNDSDDERWDQLFTRAAQDESLWNSSIHNSNYRPLDYFYALWQRTNQDQWLNEGSKLTLYHMLWSLPMLTVAEATTDRVWLPQRLVNRMALGDLSILRNEIFPKHAVSWEHASGRFAPLVRKHGEDSLEVELYNLEPQELTVNARIWELTPGWYQVSVKQKRGNQNEDSRVDKDPKAQKIFKVYLQRYSLLPIAVPAESSVQIEVTQLERGTPLEQLPDLAISPLDARYDKESQELTVVIHNIGLVPSGAFVAEITVNGNKVLARELDSLSPPSEFRTAKYQLVIPVKDWEDDVQVEIRRQAGGDEITLHNNVLKLQPKTLFQPHFLQRRANP